MLRLAATAIFGYVAYKILREVTDPVPEDFGSHLPQQHRRTRPKPTGAATKRAPRRKANTETGPIPTAG
ncbi:MAG: hypothetical protein KF874_14425 [Rhizobiaceae bacterium]|nr:hypothetical protein [Rhizobiaceae bacterium]